MSRPGGFGGRVAAAIVWLVVLAPGGAAALETEATSGPVTARVRLTPDAPKIGDPLSLEIEVAAEPGVELLMPEFGEALDRFAITDFVPKERVDDTGRTVVTQRYTLQTARSGDHRLPSILVEFVDRRPGRDPAPAGADAYELLTDPLPFAVESVVVEDAGADLAPPQGRLEPLSSGIRLWPWVTGMALLLAVASLFLYRAYAGWRRSARRQSAYELARAELDALLAAPRPGADEVDAFFVELSGTVRRYLESRFALRSPELTTEEFLAVLSDSPHLLRSHQEILREFLEQADLVKFAHVVPTEADVNEALRRAGAFLEETREIAVVGEPAAPRAAVAAAGGGE